MSRFSRPCTLLKMGWCSLASRALLLAIVYVAVSVVVVSADPVYQRMDDRITPDRVGSGELLCRMGESYTRLPMIEMDVELVVTGLMVRGTVTQSFRNPYSETIEAVYVFPLPENAAVDEMEIRVGPRRIVSVIQERGQARQTYERAKQQGAKTALLEQERPNLFTSSVANINPKETVRVRIEYLHEAEREGDRFGLTFPLAFTPRYVPDVVGFAFHPDRTIHPISSTVRGAPRITPPFVESSHPAAPRARFHVSILAGLPLDRVSCMSHSVETEKRDDTWIVRPSEGTLVADRDFILEWLPKASEIPQTALLTEERDGTRYALMMVIPPSSERDDSQEAAHESRDRLSTETLFIIDVSSSMDGPSIEQARDALVAALGRLQSNDTFDLLKFSNTNSAYRASFQEASPLAISNAQDWVRRLRADGGTEIHAALVRGLNLMQGRDNERVRRIILLTDGAVGNEQEVLEWIHANLGDIRLHVLGIGCAPNRYLMRKLAVFGHGVCEFISARRNIENRISNFLNRIERPVMTDLDLRWEGADVEEIYPSRLTDLHEGEPIYLSARVSNVTSDAHLVLTGRTAQREVEFDLPLNPNATHGSGVATRWARAKVSEISDTIMREGQRNSLRDAIIEIGMEFKLVTQYTSLVAVDEMVTAQGPAEMRWVAGGLPHGSRLLRGTLPRGGTSGPLQILIGLVLTATGILTACLLARRGS